MAHAYSVLLTEIKAGCQAEWAILNHQYPCNNALSTEKLPRLSGLYFLVIAILFANEYLFQLIWWAATKGYPVLSETFLYQDLLRYGVMSFLYVVPILWYLRRHLELTLEDIGCTSFDFQTEKSLMFAGFVAIVFMLSFLGTEQFASRYFDNTYQEFFLWQSFYSVQLFAEEFFFRGALLLVLARFFGLIAIPMMLVPYVMLSFDQPVMVCLSMGFAGILFAWMTLRTGSIMLSACIHISAVWVVALFS